MVAERADALFCLCSEAETMRPEPCPNLNHRQTNPPVRYCPNCGKVVNDRIATKMCSEEAHGRRRMQMSKFCVDCAERLIK